MTLELRETESYWNPTQIKCYAVVEGESVWIDDAVGIDLRTEDQRLPHYGYRDIYFRDVSYGKSLVSGNLYVAFRYPNYLSNAIQNAGFQPTPISAPTDRGESILTATGLKPTDSDKSYEESNIDLLRQAIQGNVKKYQFYAEDFKNAFLNDETGPGTTGNTFGIRFGEGNAKLKDYTSGNSVSQVTNRDRPADVQRLTGKRLSIQIRYGDHTYQQTPSFIRTVEGIVFNTESHTVTMLDGSGDQVLLEVYGFFARRITSR